MASTHAASKIATTCNAIPTNESKLRRAGLRIAARAARPSTTPAISPITTRPRIRNSARNNLVRCPSTLLTTCGASRIPATPPSTTPNNDKSEPSAPLRQPDDGGHERDGQDREIKPL